MSYILDALRKSQQTRQPGAATVNRNAVHNVSYSLPVGGWWLALGIVLLCGMLIAGYFVWRGTVSRLPDPPANPPTSQAAMAPEHANTTVAPPEKVTAAPDQALPKKAVPVSDLAEQAKLPTPPAPKKPVAAKIERKPAAKRQPVAAKTENATADRPAAASFPADDVPLLQQMPAEFQRALPPLALTIHVFSHEESQRILFLNNKEYRRGSHIEGGVRVEEIVPEGVVLSFQGQRFKLSRPR